MASQWYCRNEAGDELGPLSFVELQAMGRDGRLGETDLVRREGADDWEKAYRVVGLLGDSAADRESPAAPAPPRSAAEAALAALTGPSPEPPPPPPRRWWQHPVDKLEIGLLALAVVLLIALSIYWIDEELPERFPKSKTGSPRFSVPDAEEYAMQKAQMKPQRRRDGVAGGGPGGGGGMMGGAGGGAGMAGGISGGGRLPSAGGGGTSVKDQK